MNLGNLKYVILGLFFLAVFVSVNAAVSLTALDVNGSPQAAPGEWFDLNVTDANYTNAYSQDANFGYFITLTYGSQAGVTYTDVNVVDGNITAGSEIVSDMNIDTQTNCSSFFSSDLNLKAITVFADSNSFDVNIQVPSGYPSSRMVLVQVWKVQSPPTGDQNICTGLLTGADVNFMITPYIKINPFVASVDQNITVFGFGFDQNVKIYFSDQNGWIPDLNMVDVNGTEFLDGNYGYKPARDLNGFNDKVYDSIDDVNWQNDFLSDHVGDYNGVTLVPDTNGNFDVNIQVPFTYSMAGPGGAPDINIRAHVPGGDTNGETMIVVTPNIHRSSDENVTVLICDYNRSCWEHDASTGIRMDLETAIINNYIDNMEAVKGFQVDFGSITGAPCAVRVQFNSDMNMVKGPQRNYDDSMVHGSGKVKIDSTEMPEFLIDANITFYNVKSTGPMPRIVKDGVICPSYIFKDTDLTTLSEDSWLYNATAGDGNISFRVSTFSDYGITTVSATMVAPTAVNQVIRGTDGNYSVDFNFSDQNVGVTQLSGEVWLSSGIPGSEDMQLATDSNILDSTGLIPCTMTDNNWATDNNCNYDFNAEHLSGTFYIDIIITHFDSNFIRIDSNTVKLNVPYVDVTESVIVAGDNNHLYADNNFAFDFNIMVPDGNSLGDYNVAIYASTTAGAKTNMLVWDENVLDADTYDYNGIRLVCTDMADVLDASGSSDYNGFKSDYNCQADLNFMGFTAERYYLDIDFNDLHMTDTNQLAGLTYTDYNNALIVNDTTAPTVSITSPANDTYTTATSTQISYTASDAVSRVEKYWVSENNTSWTDNGSNTTYTFSIPPAAALPLTMTYHVKSMDYSDLNSDADSVIVNFTSASGGETPAPDETPAPGPGGGPDGEPTDETTEEVISETSATYTPTAEEIEELLTDAGLTEEEIAAAQEVAGNFAVTRTLAVTKITSVATGAISYESSFTVSVENTTEDTWQDVSVVETIPKAVAESASEIESVHDFIVLQEDPVIQFIIAEVLPGETVEVEYSVAEQIAEETLADMPAAIAFGEIYIDPCEGVYCNDGNPCTIDRCVEGDCVYTNAVDGTSCGADMVCEAGACIELVAPPECIADADCAEGYQCVDEKCVEKAAPPPMDYTWLYIVIVIIIILAIVYFVLKGKKKGLSGV